ncbi:protein MULTIPLE CHLOROPLAST DIVISION SITE 1 [Lolium perenne]|uniref:protein MULTIPLE CHLOROPLAST DIVISION SITE 1 n=1 Tax=Lolium perenne TaxID=4522 RepID=UPI0021F5D411|nr:protein MULTIPLE CHLOROPLAST DIVISION SITE 1 [Lolium perenne]
MAPASVAVSLSLSFRLVPPRPSLLRPRWLRPVRASSDTTGAPDGGRRVGALERRVGDLKALVASVPPAVVSIRKNIGLNSVAGFCFGVAFLAAVGRQIMIRTRQQDNSGSVSDLVRRGHLKSGPRGIAKPQLYNDPFNNPLVKIDEDTSTAEVFGKEYRLAPVRLTNEQQAMHQKRRSHTYQWKRPTVYLKEGDPLPADVDPETVRWIPGNHPFAAGSVEVDEETAKKNVYQKDGVPSRVKAEHEALRLRLEASNDVTPFSSGPRNVQGNERSLRLSHQPSGDLQHSESDMVDNQHGQSILEPEKQSSDNNSQSKSLEEQ